jgi:hypothetical protein
MEKLHPTPAERARWRYFVPMLICAGLWIAASLASGYIGEWRWFVLAPAFGTVYFGRLWLRALRRLPIDPKQYKRPPREQAAFVVVTAYQRSPDNVGTPDRGRA